MLKCIYSVLPPRGHDHCYSSVIKLGAACVVEDVGKLARATRFLELTSHFATLRRNWRTTASD